MIIKKEKEKLIEDKNDNYLRLSCDVHVKVENGFDNCVQNSVLSNNRQETFNYDNFKEEKQSCSICSEDFINSHSLYKHHLKHLKVPLVQCKPFLCNVCSNFYNTKKQLQNHITTAHKDKTLYKRTNSLTASLHKCEVCKKVLKYKTWNDHRKHIHKQPKLPCNKCNKLFKCPDLKKDKESIQNVKRLGRKRVYQEYMTLQCPNCPKISKCKTSLARHIKNCHSEGTFQCKICKSVLKSKEYLWLHMNRVHYDDGMLHHCDRCGKSFKSPRKVKIHQKKSQTCQKKYR